VTSDQSDEGGARHGHDHDTGGARFQTRSPGSDWQSPGAIFEGAPEGLKPIAHYRGGQLSRASSLFQTGDLDSAPDDEAFFRRLNTCVKLRLGSCEPTRAPKSLAEAIDKDGQLHADAGPRVLDQYRITESTPGAVTRDARAMENA